MRTWTTEERQAQAEAIRRWKPWVDSTGPKTEEGKAHCRMNAHKHGRYAAATRARDRERREITGLWKTLLKGMKQILQMQKHLKMQEQTIKTDDLIKGLRAEMDALTRCLIQSTESYFQEMRERIACLALWQGLAYIIDPG